MASWNLVRIFVDRERGWLMRMQAYDWNGKIVKSCHVTAGMKVNGAIFLKRMEVIRYVAGSKKVASKTTFELKKPASDSDESPYGITPTGTGAGDSKIAIEQPAGAPFVAEGIAAWGENFYGETNVPAATLRVVNNDSDENPCDIALTGAGTVGLTVLESWRQLYFGTAVNSGNGADLVDFDHDGLTNLVEFAFGQNPTEAGSAQLPQAQISGGNYLYSFAAPDGVSGITYHAEWSTTLQPNDWHPTPDIGTAPNHRFSVPVAGEERFFLRCRITTP